MNENKKKVLLAVHTLLETSYCRDESEDEFILSDSDSDDENFVERVKRNSIPEYFEKVVTKYSDVEYVRHFRIQRTLSESLAEKFKESVEYKKLKESISYSAEKHIAIFPWFAGHEACAYRDISDRFDVSISTVSLVIKRVTSFISSLSDSTFLWPDEEGKRQSEEFFKTKHDFPGIIGAIDGTHIVIDPPKRSKDDFLNRKNDFSICLQGIANHNKTFMDIFVGFPGSVHDSRVFKNSFVYPKLDQLCGDYHILGDSAYPCIQYLLTPYRDNGHLTRSQICFNKCLSSQRVIIEHTFGILKQRFRQLYYCKLRGIGKLCHFIRACCVLHNLANESDLDDLDDAIILDEEPSSSSMWNEDSAAGKRKCDEIARELFTQGR